MEKKPIQKSSTVTLLVIAISITIILNIAFISFTLAQKQTIRLLRKEVAGLDQDRQILTSAQDIYNTYEKEIEAISKVFPNEETIPLFIGSLEQDLRETTDSYSVKFSSLTPLVEQDKLYLLLIISLKTDLERLTKFFDRLERRDYMTHIVSISAKTPEAFTGVQEVSVGIKIYVQNPFSNQ